MGEERGAELKAKGVEGGLALGATELMEVCRGAMRACKTCTAAQRRPPRLHLTNAGLILRHLSRSFDPRESTSKEGWKSNEVQSRCETYRMRGLCSGSEKASSRQKAEQRLSQTAKLKSRSPLALPRGKQREPNSCLFPSRVESQGSALGLAIRIRTELARLSGLGRRRLRRRSSIHREFAAS